MPDQDVLAEVETALALTAKTSTYIAGQDLILRNTRGWLRALVTRCREAEDTQQLLTECVAERDFNRHERDEAEAEIAAIREAIHDEDRVVDDGLIKRVKGIIYDFSDLVKYSDRLETANAELAIERDRLTAEVERLKTEVSIADQYDREANAKMLARQCDLARQAETDLALIQRTNDTLRQRLARHEQDIEAAVRRGWNAGVYAASNGDRIDGSDDVEEFVARYRAERQQEGR